MADERGASPEVDAPDTPARTPEARPAPAPGGPSGRRMRARLARMATKSTAGNPVLEPLFRVVRANHPKADLALIERAYQVAEKAHGTQTRKSGDPYITHPLAVATILAELGMTERRSARRCCTTRSRTPTYTLAELRTTSATRSRCSSTA